MRTRTGPIHVVAVTLLASFWLLACLPALASPPGSLVAWGDNTYGQCNNIPKGDDYAAVDAGAYHSLALKTDGSIVAWGYNGDGECNVPAGNDFKAVSAGVYHSLALRSDGSLVAWGWNNEGQCNVPAGNDFAAISAGYSFSVALKVDGSLVAWGSNLRGECDVPAGKDYVAVSGSGLHSVALKSDGSLAAWGSNGDGECDVLAGNNFAAVAAGTYFSAALRSDGSLPVWGANYWGDSGVPAGNNYVAVSANFAHFVALKSDGSLSAWGSNDRGEGIVPAGRNYGAVSAGEYHNVAIAYAPMNVSVTPSGGSLPTGSPTSIQCVYHETGGYAGIKRAYLLLNDSLGQINAALCYYDRVANKIYLKNDANTSWGTGYAPGTAVTLSNSQCDLCVGSTTVSGDGDNLTVNWRVSLKTPFSTKNVNAYMYVLDVSGLTDGWDLMGRYYNVKPQVVGVDPDDGELPIDIKTTLTSLYRDLNGFADLRKCYLLVNDSPAQSNAVFIWYDQVSKKLYLKNDANTSWGTGYALGTDVTLSNSQCDVYVKDTTATGSGSDLTVVWSFKLKPSMTDKNLYSYMYVTDSKAAFDGWKKVGTHFTPVAPTCVGVTPSTGIAHVGSSLLFTTQYSDDNGSSDIHLCYFQLSSTSSQANAVFLLYDAKQNKIFLRNDANTAWGTGVSPGTDQLLGNSQCFLFPKSTDVFGIGTNHLSVNWRIQLRPSQDGKTLCERMYVRDNENLSSGWKVKGYVAASFISP